MTVFNLVIHVAFGAALVVLALALHNADRQLARLTAPYVGPPRRLSLAARGPYAANVYPLVCVDHFAAIAGYDLSWMLVAGVGFEPTTFRL